MQRTALSVAIIALLLITGCSLGPNGEPPRPIETPVPVQPAQPVQAAPATPSTSVPAQPKGQPVPPLTVTEPSVIRYEVVTVAEPVADKTAYLDQIMAERNWPEPEMLLLVIFAGDNYDIRFGMGTIFHQKQITVDQVLSLVRSEYLPEARKGDPSTGLSQLSRAINQLISQ